MTFLTKCTSKDSWSLLRNPHLSAFQSLWSGKQMHKLHRGWYLKAQEISTPWLLLSSATIKDNHKHPGLYQPGCIRHGFIFLPMTSLSWLLLHVYYRHPMRPGDLPIANYGLHHLSRIHPTRNWQHLLEYTSLDTSIYSWYYLQCKISPWSNLEIADFD